MNYLQKILSTVLITVLLLSQNTMTKATYRRKHVMGACSFRRWVCGHHGRKHDGKQAGRLSGGAVTESWYLIHKHRAKKKQSANGMALGFETSKLTLCGTPAPTRPQSLIGSKQFLQLWTKHSNIWVYRWAFSSKLQQTPCLCISRLWVLRWKHSGRSLLPFCWTLDDWQQLLEFSMATF